LGELGHVPFGIDLLFESGALVVGMEICEDLWMPVPPSSLQAAAGANLLINLSASNEIIGKASYRELLVRSQSGRCLRVRWCWSDGIDNRRRFWWPLHGG
jgi:NAD+ synthase (glutamine-hydrolysing)